jgi:small-conductance mechanosensitive channel
MRGIAMPPMNEILSLPLFQNTVLAGIVACGVTIAVIAGLIGLRQVARRYHQRYARSEREEVLEIPFAVLAGTTFLFLLVVAIYAGLRTLTMAERTTQILDSAIMLAVFWQVGLWLSSAVSAWLERKRRRAMAADRALVGSIALISLAARTTIWALVLMLTLENLGVDITALVAGLGIGGVAVALAVQNILGDLFASLSIALDKPFVVGDFLQTGEYLGTVEYIGIKSTRLRSLSGEQIVMSNADLLGSRIRNYGRMADRRVVFTLNVAYETPPDLLARIPGEIRAIIEAQKDTRFDRSHFASYGPHQLVFETVYYVLSADYNRYMDIQQAINLALYRRFEEMGVRFAYPTQKLYVTRARMEQESSVSARRRA